MAYKLGLIAFLLFSFSPQEKESKTIYFLLNKDSQKISYREAKRTIKSMPYRLGCFYFDNSLNQGIILQDPLVTTYTMHKEAVIKSKMDTLTKPRSFLNQITYYDENYLMNPDSRIEELIPPMNEKFKYWVIDTSGIYGDSIKLYEYKLELQYGE